MDESRKRKRQKHQRMGLVRRIVLLVCIVAFLFSGYQLLDNYLEYKKGSDLYGDLEQSFVTIPSEAPQPTDTPTPIPSPVVSDTPEPSPEESAEPESPQITYVEDYAPDIWPQVDFAGLREVNADASAWLLCVGTNINYPVVQSHDNEDYLYTMFDGRSSKVGSIFIDYRNDSDFSDRNTIIYGHNMRNHSMFWTVTQYKSQSFYNAHPTMRLITPEGKYEIQLFAGFTAKATDLDVWSTYFKDDDAFISWIHDLFDRSTFKSYVDLEATDRVVTLSTCTYDYADARYVVMGKLVPVS